MYYTGKNLVVTFDVLDAILDYIDNLPIAELFATPELGCFVNDFTPGPGSAYGDYTEATFSGYAAVSLASLSANLSNGPDQKLRTQSCLFAADASLAGPFETIYGVFVNDGSSTAYAGERLDTPITIDSVGEFLQFDFNFTLDAALRRDDL